MRRILAIESGRHDATPLKPVVSELRRQGCHVLCYDVKAGAIENAFKKPWDIVLLLGDRWESLAVATVAVVANVPIAHIHGGEATFGSHDNQIRDAISKLASIHFVANDAFKCRLVLGLGEDGWRVHVTGAPGLDNLTNLPPRSPEAYFVCTYHPATLQENSDLPALLSALDRFPDYQQIWTGVNDDPGSKEIAALLAGRDVRLLSDREYHLLCRHAAAVVGNSSSGIIEAPTLGVPTVNVGTRQEGRLQGPSVFDCDAKSIHYALVRAIKYGGPYENPYGEPGASAKIARVLSTIDLEGIQVKRWSV